MEVYLGIFETYYFNKYYNFDSDKGGCIIRGLVLLGTINDITSGSLSILCGLIATKYCNNGNNWNTINIVLACHFFKFCYLIAVILSFNNNILPCHKYIIHYIPEFWTFAMIHFVSGFVVVGIIIIVLLSVFIFKIYKCIKEHQIINIDQNNYSDGLYQV